jgi:arylsulfatase A-like enzyme/Tfp pilus assembly protein PilF
VSARKRPGQRVKGSRPAAAPPPPPAQTEPAAAARPGKPPRPPARRAARWAAVLLAGAAIAACLFVLAGRGPWSRKAGPFKGAPIILISIDTLRSDHLPAYGYRRVETPAIDALARDSILYERAYSHVPLTLPSHASIFSGRLPGDNGVRDNIGYHFEAARFHDLPVALHAAGYATGGAVSAFVLRAETGMSEGFDYYDSQVDVELGGALGLSQRAGRLTEELLVKWLRQAAGHQPVFAFLHLYEPHTPYTPPEPFASRYREVPYDGEIATADWVVGDFLAELKKLDLYDRAIVVLLSDHGEGLGDHGERDHGLLLYREALQVPLLLKLPGALQKGRRVTAPAQLVDVYPTLLELAGLPVPPGLPGRSLLDLERGGQPPREIYAETFYPRLHFGWSELSSLVRDRFHYIHGPDPELYDLAADPGERASVLYRERPAFVTLRADIVAYQRALAAPGAVDQETRQRLAALGYAGAAVAVAANERLPDPKSRIASLRDLFAAMNLFSAQHYAEAVPAFRTALRANPRMVDAWEHLALALERLGQLRDSLAASEQALKLSGGSAPIAIATGYVLLEMGRYDEAKAHAELGRREAPGSAESLLAAIALARHQPEAAVAAARAAIAAGGVGGTNLKPLVSLASARVSEGKLTEALALLDQADRELAQRAHGQTYPGLAFERGDILARMGRNAEAEQAFQRAIKEYPSAPSAYASLAMLYAAEDRAQEALGTLQRLVDTNRSPAAYGMAVQTLRVLGDPRDAAALLQEGMRRFPGSPELAALSSPKTPR